MNGTLLISRLIKERSAAKKRRRHPFAVAHETTQHVFDMPFPPRFLRNR
jgi:hypothetical protein